MSELVGRLRGEAHYLPTGGRHQELLVEVADRIARLEIAPRDILNVGSRVDREGLTSFIDLLDDRDRNRARPAVGEGFPFPALSIAGRVHIPTMADVSRRPPIIPDGRISQVRFETLACLPWAFPKFGEV
jgi:hypothetical protein